MADCYKGNVQEKPRAEIVDRDGMGNAKKHATGA